jgi:hypothetical protein
MVSPTAGGRRSKEKVINDANSGYKKSNQSRTGYTHDGPGRRKSISDRLRRPGPRFFPFLSRRGTSPSYWEHWKQFFEQPGNGSRRLQHRSVECTHYRGSSFGKHRLRATANVDRAELGPHGRKCAHIPLPGFDRSELHEPHRPIARGPGRDGRVDRMEGGTRTLFGHLSLACPVSFRVGREQLFCDCLVLRRLGRRRTCSAAAASSSGDGNDPQRPSHRSEPR